VEVSPIICGYSWPHSLLVGRVACREDRKLTQSGATSPHLTTPVLQMKDPRKPYSQTVPISSVPRTTALKKWFTSLLHHTGHRSREQSVDSRSEAQGRGTRESAIVTSPWGWKVLWVVAKVLGKFLRVRKLPGIDRRLSAPHDSDPPEWEYVIGGLIDVIFSDYNEVKAIEQLSGGDAQVFTDMVYGVHLCILSSQKTKCTNFPSGIGFP